MTFTDFTISDLERLVRAVQATRPDDPAVVQAVIERMAADPALRYGRITVASILAMLDTWHGSTVPPEPEQATPETHEPAVDTADPYQAVRHLLGNDLITPEDITQTIGLPYTRQQLQAYSAELPNAEILQWCHDRHYFLVAGPHVALSVLEVFELFTEIFPEEYWLRYRQHLSGGNLSLGVRWLAINIRPQQLLRGKTYPLQQKLLHPEYERPAGMVGTAWVIAMAKKVRNITLDGAIRTNTSTFIYQQSNGLAQLSSVAPEQRAANLGLAVICWPTPEQR